jgi:hypothetical protein
MKPKQQLDTATNQTTDHKPEHHHAPLDRLPHDWVFALADAPSLDAADTR